MSRKKHKRFNWNSTFMRTLELIIDVLLIVLGFVFVYTYENMLENNSTFINNLIEIFSNSITLKKVLISNGVYIIISFILFSLYRNSLTKKSFLEVCGGVLSSLLLTNVLIIIIDFLFPKLELKPIIVIFTFLVQFVLLFIFKLIYWLLIIKRNVRLILLCGKVEEINQIAPRILLSNNGAKRLKYLYYEIDGEVKDDIFDFIDRVDEVYLTRHLEERNKTKIMFYCIAKKNINVYLIPKTYEISIVSSNVDMVGDSLSFEVKTLYMSNMQKIIKRLLDIVISSILIIILSPLMIIISLILKCQGVKNIISKEECITRFDKTFNLYRYNVINKNNNETKFGRFLINIKLNGLLELFNVLFGQISLIGPSIITQDVLNSLTNIKETYAFRLNVKSGIVSYANVLSRGNISFEDQLRYDLYYIRKYSLWFDIKVLLLAFLLFFAPRKQEIKIDTLQHVADLKECEVNRLTDNVYRIERDY